MAVSRELWRRLLAGALCVVLSVYLWIFAIGTHVAISTHEHSSHVDANHTDTKTIYVWDRPKWLFITTGPTTEDFDKLECEVSNCRLVDSASYPAENIHDADSILFTIKDFYKNPPQRVNTDQIWIFWNREAPLHYFPIDLDTLNDVFNLTFTYLNHTDTDIYSPVGKIINRPYKRRYKPRSMEFARKKNRAVAWVVSNCDSRGQRSEYVKELSKYIKVDVFGKCGKKCPSKNEFCMKMIESKYRFYLAFESMYCQDYVTEKMYRTLSYDVIPIALGGADYAQLLPRDSFIDVRDFQSPKQLAKYLRQLMNDDEAFLEYFDWKKNRMAVGYCTESLCDLCKILHTPDYHYKSGFNLDEYWDADTQCLYGHRERDALHL